MTSFKDLVIYIALWDEELGVRIISSRPESTNLDLYVITTQILIAFQNFFYNEEKNIINRTFFKIPISNIIRKARIFVDSLDKDGKIKPLIVVLLLPEYAPDIKDFSGNVAVFASFTNIINTLDFTLKI